MSDVPRTRAPLPSELLHKILTSVLAESIHTISISPNITKWDSDVVWTLVQTCFTWKEIVKGILTLAFAIGGEFAEKRIEYSDSEFFHLVQLKITQLRSFGERSREPLRINLSLHPIVIQESCPLNRCYSLYLTSTALRHFFSQSGDLSVGAHASIIDALRVSLELCAQIKPVGLAVILAETLKREILVVEFGTTLAQARISLEDCLDSQGMSSSLASNMHQIQGDDSGTGPFEDEELDKHDIKMEMHKSLQLIERASCASCKHVDTDTTEVRQILTLSKILDTLKKFCSLSLDLDEYDLRERASTLVERWCTITK